MSASCMCVCVCVCARTRVRACVRACVRVYCIVLHIARDVSLGADCFMVCITVNIIIPSTNMLLDVGKLLHTFYITSV